MNEKIYIGINGNMYKKDTSDFPRKSEVYFFQKNIPQIFLKNLRNLLFIKIDISGFL